MKKNIEDYVFHKENFLDKDYCEKAISELSECKWIKHEWYTPTPPLPVFQNLPPVGRDNEGEVIDMEMGEAEKKLEEINDFLIENLRAIICEYIESFNFDWFGGWEGYTGIKFIRYFPGQEMKVHCDHIHSMFDGERKGVPILSIIGHFNDDYKGGETYMFEDKKIDTKQGDILVFPSNFIYPHKITPVTKGVRYSYVSWIW